MADLARLAPDAQDDPDIVVKPSVEHPYLEALNYAMIRQMTTIPVPRVIQVTSCASTGGVTYMVIERIRGRTLEAAWPQLSVLAKLRVACTLRTYVAQLRLLRRSVPGTLDGSVSDGRYFNIDGSTPFSSYADLTAYWNHKLFVSKRAGHAPHDTKGFDESAPLVFTHGDLCMRNILLGDDGKVYILDWAWSGFYPQWLEYACMRQAADPEPRLWQWLMPFIAGWSLASHLSAHGLNFFCTRLLREHVLPHLQDRLGSALRSSAVARQSRRFILLL